MSEPSIVHGLIGGGLAFTGWILGLIVQRRMRRDGGAK